MRSLDTHLSQIWKRLSEHWDYCWSVSCFLFFLFYYYIVGTCFVKYLIIFRMAISDAMTQDTSFVWRETAFVSQLISNAGYCYLKDCSLACSLFLSFNKESSWFFLFWKGSPLRIGMHLLRKRQEMLP